MQIFIVSNFLFRVLPWIPWLIKNPALGVEKALENKFLRPGSIQQGWHAGFKKAFTRPVVFIDPGNQAGFHNR